MIPAGNLVNFPNFYGAFDAPPTIESVKGAENCQFICEILGKKKVTLKKCFDANRDGFTGKQLSER